MSTPPEPIAYRDEIEQAQPDEAAIVAKIVEHTRHISQTVYNINQRAMREQHAKTHGVLKGKLTIMENLPPALRQGLFAQAAQYDVIVRLSTAPGEILADALSMPKGFALKVLGVPGVGVQDFLMVNGKALGAGTVASYLKAEKLLDKHADDSTTLKHAVNVVAKGIDTVLHTVGTHSAALVGFGTRNTHVLGETFNTLGALRYGDHVAKIAVTPVSRELKALHDTVIDTDGNPAAQRDLVQKFFQERTGEYALQVQLCTDLARMPVEDASVVWDEEVSPFVTVAMLEFPVQNTCSPARLNTVDALSFSPWHCLPAHRPLGSIMRVRKAVYQASVAYRREMNMQPALEPATIDEIPD